MLLRNIRLPLQIRQRPRDPQDFVIGPRAQPQRIQRPFQQRLARVIQFAVLPQRLAVQVRVEAKRRPVAPRMLPLPRRKHLVPHLRRRRPAYPRIGQLVETQRRNIHMNVNTVQQRTRQPPDVALYVRRTAPARPPRVRPAAARAHRR